MESKQQGGMLLYITITGDTHGGIGEDRVRTWLENRSEDLITGSKIARGWEACTVVVISDGRREENCAMRAISHLIVVIAQDQDEEMGEEIMD